MRVKIITYLSFLLLLSLALVSCEKRGLHDPTSDDMKIRWDIRSGAKRVATKSLITSPAELQNHCTREEDGGEGEGIGFWADIQRYDGTNISVEKDVFGSAQTSLIYFPNSDDPVKWDYEAEPQFWSIGGKYVVRSFYPQSMNQHIVHSSTSADLFALEYNTHTLQEDLLVSFNEVHTLDPVTNSPSVAYDVVWDSGLGDYVTQPSTQTGSDEKWKGYSQPFDLNNPIPLFFKHTLAAVRVRFTFSYDEEDELVSCSFSNTGADQGVHTVGVLIYGDIDGVGDLVSKSSFRWSSYQSSFDATPFYTWNVRDNVDGSKIKRETKEDGTIEETMAMPYCRKDRHFVRVSRDNNINGLVDHTEIISEEEVEGENNLPVIKTVPPLYNENDGWLFIVPQQQQPKVQIEFRTKRLGSKKISLPVFTGTHQDGTQTSDRTDPTASWFVAGHRYTYTVVIKHTDVEIVSDVQPWNELYSSYEILL